MRETRGDGNATAASSSAATATAALLSTSAAEPLDYRDANGDLGAQVVSLIGLLRSVSGNVECVLETLRSCANQLQSIALQRKSARMRALLAGDCSDVLAPATTAMAGVEKSDLSLLPGECQRGDDKAPPLMLLERPTTADRRRLLERGGGGRCGGGGGGCCIEGSGGGGGGGGLDDVHDLDWDLSGLELGHTQRSQTALFAAAVSASWSVGDGGICDELATAVPSPELRRERRLPSPAVGGTCCASRSHYEENMERALERCSAFSSHDTYSDNDDVTAADDNGPTEEDSARGDGGIIDEARCPHANASPTLLLATASASSSAQRRRREADLKRRGGVQPRVAATVTSLWDYYDGEGSRDRGGNYCSVDCSAKLNRADAIGGDCEEECDGKDNDDRIAYDPAVNTWHMYALTCAAEDRL